MRSVIAIALAIPASAHAGQATCSNPGLPAGASASSELVPDRLVVGITTGLLPIHGTQTLAEPTGPLAYESSLSLIETRLSAEYAITPWLAAGFALPYRVVSEDVTYRDPDSGMEVMPGQAGIHARDERLTGFGDLQLHAHLAHELGRVKLHARIGATLPLGKTLEEDPFILGSIGQEHEHIQFGTGTIVPFLAVEAQYGFLDGGVIGSAWAIEYLSLYDNDIGYRAGDRTSGGLTATSSFGTRAWTVGLGAELHAETAETWSGVTHPDEGNAGRQDLYIGGSVAFRPLDTLAFTFDAKLPVYSHVVGEQLDYTAVFGLGVVLTFDLPIRRADWHGLDEQVAGPAGTAPPLTPVPGKLAIYDLWASWCAPCRELDTKLAELARRYPDKLAVRKLEVVDPDSVAWKTYLEPGNFDLPHVRVVRPDGSIALEKTAPPDELIAAIEALLAAH